MKLSMFQQLIENGRLTLRLVKDPRVPSWIRIGIPVLVVLYLVTPIDLIPDFLIGPGELDDIGVVLLGMSLMARLAPSHIVDQHRRSLGIYSSPQAPKGTGGNEKTIDTEYRVIPPDDRQR